MAVDKSKVGDCGRSREGAWIEIKFLAVAAFKTTVAPARERGLKFGFYLVTQRRSHRRSREGAWIEICRGAATAASAAEVAPARERGLKYRHNNSADADRQSLP